MKLCRVLKKGVASKDIVHIGKKEYFCTVKTV